MFSKISYIVLSFAFFALQAIAQAPEGFKYQAVIRDAGNNILTNQQVGLQIVIIQGGAVGVHVYTEEFSTATNAFGLVNLEIGTGLTVDDFSIIDW